MAGKFTALPATPEMHKCGISFLDVESFAEKAVALVQSTGTTCVALLRDGFKVYQGVTGRDFSAVFAALNDANADAAKIVEAIKETFGI